MKKIESEEHDVLREEISSLREEINKLRQELELRDESWEGGANIVWWLIRKWWVSDFIKAGKSLSSKVGLWQKGESQAPAEESFQFGVAVFARLTRIGIFRISVTVLIFIASLWFAAAQVMLLKNQNHLIDSQNRAESANLYIKFSNQHQEVLRIFGKSWDHWYPLKGLNLTDENNISPDDLRKSITAATPTQTIYNEIVLTCGISKYPVGNPLELSKTVLSGLSNGISLAVLFHDKWDGTL